MSSQTKGEWRKYVALIQQKFATFLLPNKCLPRRLHTNITKYRLNMFPEIPDFLFSKYLHFFSKYLENVLISHKCLALFH